MKWGEFKKAVEAAGVTDEMTVSFVDVYCPEAATELRVEIEPVESSMLAPPPAELEFAVTN
jgi:hypothetical protein